MRYCKLIYPGEKNRGIIDSRINELKNKYPDIYKQYQIRKEYPNFYNARIAGIAPGAKKIEYIDEGRKNGTYKQRIKPIIGYKFESEKIANHKAAIEIAEKANKGKQQRPERVDMRTREIVSKDKNVSKN